MKSESYKHYIASLLAIILWLQQNGSISAQEAEQMQNNPATLEQIIDLNPEIIGRLRPFTLALVNYPEGSFQPGVYINLTTSDSNMAGRFETAFFANEDGSASADIPLSSAGVTQVTLADEFGVVYSHNFTVQPLCKLQAGQTIINDAKYEFVPITVVDLSRDITHYPDAQLIVTGDNEGNLIHLPNTSIDITKKGETQIRWLEVYAPTERAFTLNIAVEVPVENQQPAQVCRKQVLGAATNEIKTTFLPVAIE